MNSQVAQVGVRQSDFDHLPDIGKCAAQSTAGDKSCSTCSARRVAICNGVDNKTLDELESLAGHVLLDAGATLYHEEDTAQHFFTLIRGTVKQYKLMPDGRRQIIGFHFQGDFLGELGRDVYASSLEAVTDVELCRFPNRRLKILMDAHPALEKNLLGKVGRELDAAKDHMLLLGRKTALERIATFLISTLHRQGSDLEDGSSLHLAMSRSDIADHLGLTTETVSRSFTKLRDAGVVTTTLEGGVTIKDADELTSISAGSDEF